MTDMSDRYDQGFAAGIQAKMKLKNKRIDELETAIVFAIGRLEPESQGCPQSGDLADELHKLADERAAWIEVAVEHNKQCKQLNPAADEGEPATCSHGNCDCAYLGFEDRAPECECDCHDAADEGWECLAFGCVQGTIGSEHLVSHAPGCPNGAKEKK